jgi:predicted amidohydrolase
VKVALCQMNSRDDPGANCEAAGTLLETAAGGGADLASLPEVWTYFGSSDRHLEVAEPIPGPTSEWLAGVARRHRMWILGGSFLERDGDRIHNTSLLFDRAGALVARYRQIHLFDVDIPGQPLFRESASITGGDDVVTASTEFGEVGLSICYDLRFPELYRRLGTGGARIITAPSAFTFETGKDHWDLLVRARAVENQVFVLAAAQVGSHPPGLACYGNAMIVDPWGTVLARAPEGEGVVVADLDFDHQDRVRASLPALNHRRTEILGL